MLLRDDISLLTLIGPGGVGKTRLAFAAAELLTPHVPDGIWTVPLAHLASSHLVVPAIANTVGVREEPGRSLVGLLEEHIGRQAMLLVLDNFEHLTDAAPEVSGLLATCPHLKVLATSRVPLHIYGEHSFPVPPLSLPDTGAPPTPDEIAQNEAVELFVQRARAVRPEFTLTAENCPEVVAICRRLDGLPLAIELAAARTRLLPPRELLARLNQALVMLTGGARDAPARHQTLRGAIAWSYDLLSDDEQRLYRQLTTFWGGWTLEAAMALADADIDLMNALTALIEHSLVQVKEQEDGQYRYEMLETLREFGLELLEQQEARESWEGHAEYFTQLAEQARAALEAGADQKFWLARLESEHANLRAAFDWAISQSDITMTCRLAVSLEEFWYAHGHGDEGRRWLKLVLDSPAVFETRVHANLYKSLGKLTGDYGDYGQAEALLEQAIALYQDAADLVGLASALEAAGDVIMYQGDYDRAAAQYQQGLDIARTARIPRRIAGGLAGLSIIAWAQGDCEQAERFASECLEIALEIDDQISISMGRTFLGFSALSRHDVDAAARWAEESVAGARDLGDFGYLALALELLGYVELERGNYSQAQAHLQESLSGFWPAREMMPIAQSLEGLAGVAIGLGHTLRGVQLLGASAALRERIAAPIRPTMLDSYERSVTAARNELDERTFARAEVEGRSWTLEQAVACALEPLDIPAVVDAPAAILTQRQIEVLRLLVEGHSNQEIADALYISPHTAITHVANIMNKLGVDSRTAAAAWAIRQGIA